MADQVTDPYTAPASDVSLRRASPGVPWLWTLYNGYVLYALTLIVIFYLVGKTPEMFRAYVGADAAASAGSRANAIAFGLMLFNYLLTLVFFAIGYLLVWRVNRGGNIALYLYAVYLSLLLGLGIYSFITGLRLPGYEPTWLDHFAGITTNAWVAILLGWGICGRIRYGSRR